MSIISRDFQMMTNLQFHGVYANSFRPIYSVFFFNIYFHKENYLKMTHRLPLSSTILQCLSSLHKNRKWWKEYLLLLWIVYSYV